MVESPDAGVVRADVVPGPADAEVFALARPFATVAAAASDTVPRPSTFFV
jgi:hypothetical protein